MLSYEDKILIKNLRQCKGFTARRLMKEFPNKNWKRRTLEDYLMNFGNVWWPSGKTWSNMYVIDSAIDQWRRRLRACVRAKGGHFEHSL